MSISVGALKQMCRMMRRGGEGGGWGLQALSPVISDAKHQDKGSVKNWDNLGSAGKSAKVSLSLA